tara:strand:- start:981 stop:1463 length:483 start_codon:yes stop_codon:yes gene_type:complete
MTFRNNMIMSENKSKAETLVGGHGPTPNTGDTVLMHYILYLGDGVSSSNYDYDNGCYVDELIDSTYEPGPFSGDPIEITIGKRTKQDALYENGDSIEGLDTALLEMKVGDKKRLFIPPEMAYGDLGASSFHAFHGYRTPPNRGLDIIVELINIKEGENNG